MSVRTQENRRRNPGVSSTNKPNTFTRKVSHKRLRRKSHMILNSFYDMDDVILPKPVRSSMDVDPSEKRQRRVQKKRFKVWKTKSWKRRSLARAKRAYAYQNSSGVAV